MTAPIAALDPDRHGSSPRLRVLTSMGGVDFDCIAVGGGPCRALIALGTGNLILTPADLLPSQTTETLAVTGSSTELAIQASVIKKETTSLPLVVLF